MITFDEQVKFFKDKIVRVQGSLEKVDLGAIAKRNATTKEKIASSFADNDDSFRKLVLRESKIASPFQVTSATYIGVVTAIAKKLGLNSKIYVGYCLPKNYALYESDLKEFNTKKEAGSEHPLEPNHCYAVINDIIYENYNNCFDNIDHIDTVEILN